jgi:hypothetical protein
MLGAFMKKVKYSPVGTAAKELNEYVNQCKDEHEAEINWAIENYGLDKELIYTEEQKRAAAEFTLAHEVRAKAKRSIEVVAGERMSGNEMKKSLESKKRRKKANGDNAKKTRKKLPTKTDLEAHKNEWNYNQGKYRGWIKSAANHYECDRKTISSIYKEK